MSSTIPKESLLFPSLGNYNMTRVILSYLNPFELQVTVSRLNKWARNFVRGFSDFSLLYSRNEPVISFLISNHHLRRFDLQSKAIREIDLEQGIPDNCTKYSSIESSDNKIFIVGGYDTTTKSTIAFLYMIADDLAAKKVATSHYERLAFSLIILGGHLFVIGGFNRGSLRICERMSVKTLKWRNAPQLQMKRCTPILCCFNNNTIYAFGGSDGYNPLNSVERLKEGSNRWEKLPDFCKIRSPELRTAGMAHQISVNEIMIFGGLHRNPINRCTVYNVSKQRITGSVNMADSEDVVNMGIHMKREKLYAFGTHVHAFNCKAKAWNTLNAVH
eukprot:TRINITY_DN5745_c0_g1_i29.p1 TRINITY_DN5745_c0_g1~~TRINITY_DN5745_c0_g1_i29.p1  ORF type:complete len:331 (+),score=31.35 TRINITY_DN5745_c0_g1_i29:98-1090(+)